MNIFAVVALSAFAIVLALRLRAPVGAAVLAGGLAMWLCVDRSPATLIASAADALSRTRTYDLLLSLFFVMCLEGELRFSGTLERMVGALNRLFASPRVTAAVMPAFLGLLPSLGGALFSAPFVKTSSAGIPGATPEWRAAVNYWFRHVLETANPTNSAMILTCAVMGIGLGDFTLCLLWFAAASWITGWLLLMAPLPKEASCRKKAAGEALRGLSDVLLALSPIFLNLFLTLIFGLPASASLGISVLALGLLLRRLGRDLPVGRILAGALRRRLFFNVACILYFISLLALSGVLGRLVEALRAAELPVPVLLAALSFFAGLLTGMTQGFIAVAMPVAAGMAPGSLAAAGLTLVFGLAGHMLTPTHLCFTLSVQYFEARGLAVFRSVLLCELAVSSAYGLFAWLAWPA